MWTGPRQFEKFESCLSQGQAEINVFLKLHIADMNNVLFHLADNVLLCWTCMLVFDVL